MKVGTAMSEVCKERDNTNGREQGEENEGIWYRAI